MAQKSISKNDTGGNDNSDGNGDGNSDSDTLTEKSGNVTPRKEDKVVASNLVMMKQGSGAASVKKRRKDVNAGGGGGTSGIAAYQILTTPAGSNSPAGKETGADAPQGSDAPVASVVVPVNPPALTEEQQKLLRELGPSNKPTGNQRSVVWKSILLLQDDDVRRLKEVAGQKATHYCFYCNTLLSLNWRTNNKGKRGLGGCYLTAGAERHLKKCERGGKEAIASLLAKIGENQKKRKHQVQEKLEKYSSLSSPQSMGKFFVFLFVLI